jgi:prophage regulatory protein
MQTKAQAVAQAANIAIERKARRALRLRQVLEKTGLSRSQLYRLIGRGDFPAGVPLSEHVRAWDEWGIDDWLAAKFGEVAQ